jgi:hypothetical protein
MDKKENSLDSALEGGFRSAKESEESEKTHSCFDRNPEDWSKKLENFPKYVRRANLTRFIALYELFKRVIHVKGSIVECGVFRGFGVMSWSKFSAILEPVNLTRRIYGFDTFSGFPNVSENDSTLTSQEVEVGGLYADSKEEIEELISINDSTRFHPHIEKTKLIDGDATVTIPKFVKDNPHILVSLLFLDFDLYEPTMAALEHFVPRMPKGAILAFDELDNPLWPGETLAMLEHFSGRMPKVERFDFDPYIGFVEI